MSEDYLKLEGEESLNCDSHYTPTKPKSPGIREQIYEFMGEDEELFSPRFVASSLELNPGSVRKIMWNMWKAGELERPLHGWYYRNSGHGLQRGRVGRRVKPRVQNLWVRADGVEGVVSDVVEWYSQFYDVTIRFGGCRGRVSYHVGVPLGLDPVGLCAVHDRVVALCVERGYVIPAGDWRVTSFEWMVDDSGVQLGDVGCVTFNHLMVGLVKWYNKSGSRKEVRPNVHVGLPELFGFLNGTVAQAEDRIRISDLQDDIVRLELLIKHSLKSGVLS